MNDDFNDLPLFNVLPPNGQDGGDNALMVFMPLNGVMNDLSGNEINGSIGTGTPVVGTTEYGGFTFDTTGRIDCESSTTLDGIKEVTILALIKPTAFTNTYNAIVAKDHGSQFWALFLRNSGKIAAYVTGATGTSSVDDSGIATAFVTGQWQSVGFAYSNSVSLRTYHNGVLENDSGSSHGNITSTAGVVLQIGSETQVGSRGFNGTIAYVKVWARALSDEEFNAEHIKAFAWLQGSAEADFPMLSSGAIDATLLPGLVTDTDTIFAPAATYSNTLTPSLVTDTDVVYAPTVTAGSVSLLPGLFGDTDVVFAPTVVSADILTPSLFNDVDTFFSPVITTGSVSLLPSLVTDTDSFYAPTVAEQNALFPGLVDDATTNDTFYVPTVSPGAVSLLPGLFGDTDIFYVPIVAPSADTLLPALFVDQDVVYAPVVQGPQQTVLFDITLDGDTFYSPTISATAGAILPSLVTDSDIVYAPAALAIYTLVAPLFVDTDTFFAPIVTEGPITLHPSLFVDIDVFYTPVVQPETTTGGGTGTSTQLPANTKYGTQITMPSAGLITKVQIQFAQAKTVNTRAMIYSDSAGLPGALVAQSGVHTTVVNGLNTYTMLVPYSVVSGTKVWIALHANAKVNWITASSVVGAKFNTDLFADGPSNPFGAASTSFTKAPVVIVFLTAVNATVAPPLFVDTDITYSPVVAATNILVPPFISDVDQIYASAIGTPSPVGPSLFSSDDIIYVPVVSATATLLPGLVVDTDNILQPACGPAGNLFTANLSADDDIIYVATVTTEGANLGPTLVSSDDQVYGPEVSSSIVLLPGLVVDGDSVYSVGTTHPYFVFPPYVGADDDVNNLSPVVTQVGGSVSLLPARVIDLDVVFASALGHRGMQRQVFVEGNTTIDEVTIRGSRASTEVDLLGDWEDSV